MKFQRELEDAAQSSKASTDVVVARLEAEIQAHADEAEAVAMFAAEKKELVSTLWRYSEAAAVAEGLRAEAERSMQEAMAKARTEAAATKTALGEALQAAATAREGF